MLREVFASPVLPVVASSPSSPLRRSWLFVSCWSQAERLWPPSEQAGAAEGAAAAGGGAGGAEGEEEGEAAAGQQGQRLRLGHEVHSRPWELGGVWAQMAAAARS